MVDAAEDLGEHWAQATTLPRVVVAELVDERVAWPQVEVVHEAAHPAHDLRLCQVVLLFTLHAALRKQVHRGPVVGLVLALAVEAAQPTVNNADVERPHALHVG